MLEENCCAQTVLGHQPQELLAKGQSDRQWVQPECHPGPGPPGFLVLSFMEPLYQAPFIILQIIMSVCAVSIATGKKLCEIMMAFMGK
jgi:hypothetical protein